MINPRRRKTNSQRQFPRMALPVDVISDGWEWLRPPSPEELMRRYQELTAKLDADRAARAVAIGLLIASETKERVF